MTYARVRVPVSDNCRAACKVLAYLFGKRDGSGTKRRAKGGGGGSG